jgi:hypothetical protein
MRSRHLRRRAVEIRPIDRLYHRERLQRLSALLSANRVFERHVSLQGSHAQFCTHLKELGRIRRALTHLLILHGVVYVVRLHRFIVYLADERQLFADLIVIH